MGSYQCKASTIDHTSISSGLLIVRDDYRFDATITPENVDVEVGGTVKYVCGIYPPPPFGRDIQLIYTWSRFGSQPISTNAIGLNTNTLTMVRKWAMDSHFILCLNSTTPIFEHVVWNTSELFYSLTYSTKTLEPMSAKCLPSIILAVLIALLISLNLTWLYSRVNLKSRLEILPFLLVKYLHKFHGGLKEQLLIDGREEIMFQ